MPVRGEKRGSARQTAIDDDAHAFDRQTRLGDRRREDDLAPTARVGAKRAILRVVRHRAEERKHHRVRERRVRRAATRRDGSRRSRAERRAVAASRTEARRRSSPRRTLRCANPRAARRSASRPERRVPRSLMIGAPPSRRDTASPSSVADMTMMRRSSRTSCCVRSVSASPRSASRLRS